MFRKGYAGYEVGEFSKQCLFHGRHMVCMTCVTAHVAVQFESTHWDNIKCPLCSGKLKMETVLTYLSGEMPAKAGGCGGIYCRCDVFWDFETGDIIAFMA
ncbi:hypothetical protein SS1G_08312 [Sclerotinia sclerotiorum 1980 UF-70]|uniref:RING-type domain-containing protein n=1 Tax=Sclerotinia sclerotiorum (strain ATCC 18683 / 1980 / Ss-1) TaxID=665079 RepID=A7ESK7_SCLS1|nr:hypothetical protein SS1G_08312 [Sclerotinia sclerotiorum 1980 UF-70]EDN92449.1 hypothetical protein SS1G_08312 [Sclerotinia sclerotiorum 1980 UF-70]